MKADHERYEQQSETVAVDSRVERPRALGLTEETLGKERVCVPQLPLSRHELVGPPGVRQDSLDHQDGLLTGRILLKTLGYDLPGVAEHVLRRIGALSGFGKQGASVIPDAIEHGADEMLLVGVVAVDGADTQAGLRRHVLHGGDRDSFTGEHPRRSGQDQIRASLDMLISHPRQKYSI